MKMKNKENGKVEKSQKKKKVKRSRSRKINNIDGSLKNQQRQIKDPKLLRNENDTYSVFAK